MIFDSHAHYDDAAYDEDREAVIASLASAGIGRVMNVGADRFSTERSVSLAAQYGFFYAAAGIHPSDTTQYKDRTADMDWLAAQAKAPKVQAIGEIGLDYHWPEPDHETQKKWFREQLILARELDLPVIIHSREAAKDTYDILKDVGGCRLSAVIHCFSYETEMAECFLRLGYYLGVGGVLTYKNARKLREVVAMCPMDRILLETDCPYLTPVPHRGERNCSVYLPQVLEEMGRIKGITAAEAEEKTYQNAGSFYRIG